MSSDSKETDRIFLSFLRNEEWSIGHKGYPNVKTPNLDRMAFGWIHEYIG